MPSTEFRLVETGGFNEIGGASHDHDNQKTTNRIYVLFLNGFCEHWLQPVILASLGARFLCFHGFLGEQLDYSNQDKEEANNFERIYDNRVQKERIDDGRIFEQSPKPGILYQRKNKSINYSGELDRASCGEKPSATWFTRLHQLMILEVSIL